MLTSMQGSHILQNQTHAVLNIEYLKGILNILSSFCMQQTTISNFARKNKYRGDYLYSH